MLLIFSLCWQCPPILFLYAYIGRRPREVMILIKLWLCNSIASLAVDTSNVIALSRLKPLIWRSGVYLKKIRTTSLIGRTNLRFDQLWVEKGEGSNPSKGEPTIKKNVQNPTRLWIQCQSPGELQRKKLKRAIIFDFCYVVVRMGVLVDKKEHVMSNLVDDRHVSHPRRPTKPDARCAPGMCTTHRDVFSTINSLSI